MAYLHAFVFHGFGQLLTYDLLHSVLSPKPAPSLYLVCSVEYSMSYEFHAMSNYYGRDCVALPGLSRRVAAYLGHSGPCSRRTTASGKVSLEVVSFWEVLTDLFLELRCSLQALPPAEQ